MPNYVSGQTITDNLAQHGAVMAWSQLCPGSTTPTAITILKERPRRPELSKSVVYKLEGVGRAKEGVIAKRWKRQYGLMECKVYQEILPHIPIPTLHFYGSVVTEDEEQLWLFMEPGGEQAYSPDTHQHRIAAGELLGRMHTATTDGTLCVGLPDRGPGHYLDHLHEAMDRIRRNLDNPSLLSSNVATLLAISTELARLEDSWNQIEDLCNGWPQTLVHGDFVAKNLSIRSDNMDITLLVFDWEMAGIGVPAVDLGSWAKPDLNTYREVVRARWPELTRNTFVAMAKVGYLFRTLAAINWEASSLQYTWLERTLRNMQDYESRLARAMQDLKLDDFERPLLHKTWHK